MILACGVPTAGPQGFSLWLFDRAALFAKLLAGLLACLLACLLVTCAVAPPGAWCLASGQNTASYHVFQVCSATDGWFV